MNSQDSWIDPDELDELVGVFSEGKKKKKKKKAGRKAASRKTASGKRGSGKKNRAGKAEKPSRAPKKSVSKSEEAPEKPTLGISSIDDLDDYLVDDTPPPLVFEGKADLEEVVEADSTDEETSEDTDILIASREGAVVFVQDDEEDSGDQENPAGGSFEIELEPEPEPEWQVEIEESSSEEGSSEEVIAPVEEEGESPLFEGGDRNYITVDENDDDYGTSNPALLGEDGDSVSKEEASTTEEDAAKAVQALAEARAAAESAELLCLRKWADLDVTESSAEEEGEPQSVQEEDAGESLLELEASDDEDDSITILDEAEEIPEPESVVEEEILDPLPEFRISPAATMVERVAEYARIVKKGVSAQSVVIRDDQGYLVYDDRTERNGPVDSIEVVRKLRDIDGSENVYFSQIRLTSGQWLCVISSPAAAGDLITQAIIEKPVRHSRLIELSQVIATAIRPANVA